MTEHSLTDCLRDMAREVLSAAAEADPVRYRYYEPTLEDNTASQHRLERLDLDPHIGICVSVQRRQRPEGELVRRALIAGDLVTSSALTVFGSTAERWKIQAWVDELAKADGRNWR